MRSLQLMALAAWQVSVRFSTYTLTFNQLARGRWRAIGTLVLFCDYAKQYHRTNALDRGIVAILTR